MDTLLIFLTLAIVVAIAYILTRPFNNPSELQQSSFSNGDYEIQYLSLLREIKTIEQDCEAGDVSEDICNQLADKKRKAADLLRLMNQALDPDQPFVQQPGVSSPLDTQPEGDTPNPNTHICPQCGYKVVSSDKFCSHCGKRLQP